MKNFYLKSACSLISCFTGCIGVSAQQERMNVLFIAVDDLRTELGCYGVEQVKTTNIDRLAGRGTVFDRAYCQQAVSSPSRTSLLTGLRPDATKVYDLVTHFRSNIPEVVTLPQHFRNMGYYTRSFGKIYHAGLDDSLSWSEKTKFQGRPMYALAENQEIVKKKTEAAAGKNFASPSARYNASTGPAYECAEVQDNGYNDGAMTDHVIALLKEEKMKNNPFFLAVGFLKPHLPFVAPKKYWDLYQSDRIVMAENPYPPENMPKIASTDWGELRAYEDIPRIGPLSETQARKLKHGYYACVSYVDAQIGRLLDELERLGLDKNTIIILWGDHGWKLGEHGMWAKHTNFENDTRAPLICYFPGQKSKGTHTKALVEFVDIYPSLCEMAGLSLPSHLQGRSFVPLLHSPNLKWKREVFSQFPRQGGIMGYSMRTDRYRFTQWFDINKKVVARELYDHLYDPEENRNLESAPENVKLVKKLSGTFRKKLNDQLFPDKNYVHSKS